MRHEPVVKLEKLDKYGTMEKINGAVEKISVAANVEKSESSSSSKRHRHGQRKSTPSDNSNDAVQTEVAPLPAPPIPVPVVAAAIPTPIVQAVPLVATPPPPPPPIPALQPATQQVAIESSSASNSPQPRRKKRKHEPQQPQQQVTTSETFQAVVSAPLQPIQQQQQQPTPCRIIMSSSPPPLAPITVNEPPPPSVWIVTPSPVIIDGSFVVKPLETEIDAEIDLKDLKVLKPAIKDVQAEATTSLTASNWYTAQPRPLALNTFNMRKINAQRYVMATQRKLIELGRTLQQTDKITNAVVKPQPKTWSFIERSQVFIPFRVTH